MKNTTIYVGPYLKHTTNKEISKKIKSQIDMWMATSSKTETIWISNHTMIGEEFKNTNIVPIYNTIDNLRNVELSDFELYYVNDIKLIKSSFENVVIEWGVVIF